MRTNLQVSVEWVITIYVIFKVNFQFLKPIVSDSCCSKHQLPIRCRFPLRDLLQISPLMKSSHQRCYMKKGVLRNFTKFKGKHLCQSLFFDKLAGLRPATLLKKKLWHRCFPVNFAKFLRTPFLQNTSGRLLLNLLLSLKYSENIRFFYE